MTGIVSSVAGWNSRYWLVVEKPLLVEHPLMATAKLVMVSNQLKFDMLYKHGLNEKQPTGNCLG
jgi:hypothetical protein